MSAWSALWWLHVDGGYTLDDQEFSQARRGFPCSWRRAGGATNIPKWPR